MPVIQCGIDMFTFSHPIKIIEDDGTSSIIYASSDLLAETIATLCKEKEITDVKLYGNQTYLQELVNQIETNYNLHYHKGNPLNIEVY